MNPIRVLRVRSSARTTRLTAIAAAALGAPFAPSAAAQSCGYTFDVVHYPAGLDPFGLAAGDLDGDARVDLVAAARGSDALAVLIGIGGAAFAPAVLHAAGTSPLRPALGDLDADGALDAVAPSTATDAIAVLLGDGTGQLALSAAYAVGADPLHAELVDLDLDGALDLVTANFAGESVSVRLGIGDGSFGSEVVHSFALPGDFGVVAHVGAGDFDEDGLPDVAVAAQIAHQMPLLFNQGGGVLAPGPHVPVANGYAYHVALGDVNGDGHLDTHVVAEDLGSLDGAFDETRLGNGDGTFCCVDDPLFGFDSRCELIDVDRDGELDHVSFGAGLLDVVYGSGTGKFPGPWFTVALGGSGLSLASGDFDQDGLVDLATTVASLNSVAVLSNQHWPTAAIDSVVPAAVAAMTIAPVVVKLTGCFLHQAQSVSIDGVLLPPSAYSSPGTSKLDVVMPLVSQAGPVDIQVVTPSGTATSTVLVTALPQPLIALETTGPLHMVSSATGTDMKTGASPGDIVLLLASTSPEPSTLPGILTADIGGAFTSLVLVSTTVVPAKAWYEEHFAIAGLPLGTFLFLQAAVLEAPGYALPLAMSNTQMGLIWY